MRCYVGIDQADLSHRIHIMDPDGKKIKELSIPNDIGGYESLMSVLEGFDEIWCAMETGHGHLVDYLRSKNAVLFSVNPYKIKQFKETQIVSGNKTDSMDARAIAEYLRVNGGRMKPMLFSSPEVERLKMLSISYERLREEGVRQLNRLIFILKQYHPVCLKLFHDFRRPIMLRLLLRWPSWKEFSLAGEREIKDFLFEHHYRNSKYVNKILEIIRNHRQVIDPETEYVLSQEALVLAKMLLLLHEGRDRLENEMKELVENHNDGKNLLSIPGCGVVLSAMILSVLGDRKDRFARSGEWRSYAGTAPVNYQSGNYLRVRMRKACNHKGKNALYQLAFTSLSRCPWARVYYDRLRNKGKWNAAALRSLSNKWAGIIYRMWKEGMPYDADRREKDFHKLNRAA